MKKSKGVKYKIFNVILTIVSNILINIKKEVEEKTKKIIETIITRRNEILQKIKEGKGITPLDYYDLVSIEVLFKLIEEFMENES